MVSGGCFESDVKGFGLVGLVALSRSRFKVKACVFKKKVSFW